MKKILLGLSFLLLTVGTMSVSAQNILSSDDENNIANFYKKEISRTKQAMPYPNLRESDVVWETCLWRTVDFREKFNQFFYFPKDEDSLRNNQSRVNLAYLIYKNVRAGNITVYDDDELRIPLTWEDINPKVNKSREGKTDDVTDEYGDLVEEGHDTIYNEPFSSDDYYQIYLKEYWYIDKQDTRMKVRIISLALVENYCKTDNEGEMNCKAQVYYWVPMNDMTVRNILAQANVYDLYNNSMERSYDEIFISRYFDSYVTRETNVYNRQIHDYFTGEDAMLESNAIEERIFDIESDMWEY